MNWVPDWLKNAADTCYRYKKLIIPVAAIGAYGAYKYYNYDSAPPIPKVDFSQFLSEIDDGLISKVTITNNNSTSSTLRVEHKGSGSVAETSLPYNTLNDVIKEMRNHNVAFSNGIASDGWNFSLFLNLLYLGLMGFYFLGGSKMLMGQGLGKSLVLQEKDTGITFKDVAGIDESKNELEEIVDFLKSPERYLKVGAKIPKGVLLSGPPGTGKTLLARAVAGEAGVPFFSISGSEFVELYVGVGASRVREMFKKADKKAPCIIFIDEIDALGGSREDRDGGGADDELNQTLNQLLVNMDGLSPNKGIIIIGATNMPESLDSALLRPGRFDRKVYVPLPDSNGREEILKIHTRDKPLDADVRLKYIARTTPNFSGADLANLANEAALHAAQSDKTFVDMSDFEFARDKVILGVARRSMILTPEQRKLTAYHEAGHALTTLYTDCADEIDKVTIIPRGKALGLTVSAADGDTYSNTAEYLLAKLVHLFGGREAERIALGEKKITNGATGDIEMATQIALRMVTEFGMSETLGHVNLKEGSRELSELTKREIDLEIKRMIEDARRQANKILMEHRPELDAIVQELLSHETLSGEEIRSISTRVRQTQTTSNALQARM